MASIAASDLAKMGLSAGGPAGGGGGGAGGADAARKKAEQEAAREEMLSAIMTAEARERLKRVALVKPDKARSIENHFIGLAQKRQLPGKVKEGALLSVLESIDKQQRATKITIKHKNIDSDSDDDNDDDLL